jgi:hypothetical protein
MAWSVPDLFLQEFQSGLSFLSPMTPDPANGHYTPLSDVDASGNYRLWTWGGWCWVSQSFVDAVQPVFFVVFSPRQFNLATGLDSHGRHISTQAAKWAVIGGQTVPASVISAFPPLVGPTPPPVPVPVPPVPVPVPPAPIPPTPHGVTLAQIEAADINVFNQLLHSLHGRGVAAELHAALASLEAQHAAAFGASLPASVGGGTAGQVVP